MASGGPTSFLYPDPPVDNHSPGREDMTQDGEIRGGNSHDKMDRGRQSQDCTPPCSTMSKNDEKNQGKKMAQIARSCAGLLAKSDLRRCGPYSRIFRGVADVILPSSYSVVGDLSFLSFFLLLSTGDHSLNSAVGSSSGMRPDSHK